LGKIKSVFDTAAVYGSEEELYEDLEFFMTDLKEVRHMFHYLKLLHNPVLE